MTRRMNMLRKSSRNHWGRCLTPGWCFRPLSSFHARGNENGSGRVVTVLIPWDDGGEGGLPKAGEGVIAKRDDTWSDIGEGVGGDGAEDGVKDIEDELDQACAADAG